jgi:hypothetical protein
MTAIEKVARRKLSLLDLAKDLDNVSRACKLMGYSRQQFYEIRRNFQTYGADGLVDRLPGTRGPHPNRIAAEIETGILDHALAHPCHGATRVEQELRLRGIQVSSGGVGARVDAQRPLDQARAPAAPRKDDGRAQGPALGRADPPPRALLARIPRAPHTGSLVAVDTFFVGVLKGVGKLYLQTAIDCHSRYAWARLYTSKLPITAIHLMNNDVLPTFEAANARIETVLSDNGAVSGRTPNWRANSSVEIEFFALVMRSMPWNHFVSGSSVRAKMVPALSDVCDRQAPAVERHHRALPSHAAG